MPIFRISFLLLFSSLSFAFPVEQLRDKFLGDGGEIEYQKKQRGPAHQIILSAPKRINNELYVEKDRRVNGELNILLLRLSSVTPLSDASQYVEKLIQENGKVEYRCQQRGCGVSSYWANNLFDERRLSGRDSDQYYYAGSIKYAGSEYWITAYLVSNALRQHLVYVTYIKKESKDVDWENGYPLSSNQVLSDEIRLLLEARLSNNPELELFVAGYTDGNKTTRVSEMEKVVNESYKIMQNKLSKTLSLSPSRINLKFVGAFHTQAPIDGARVWFRLFLYAP